MKFSRFLSICMFVATVFFTSSTQAMQNPQNQNLGCFTRSLSATKSFLNRTTDLIIKYGLLKPAELWFEGQPKSEQERIVRESKEDSIAIASFKKLYGEQEYQKLLKQKEFIIPICKNNLENLKPLAIIVLLTTNFLLQHQYDFKQASFRQQDQGFFKNLPANFTSTSQMCQIMPYLDHNLFLRTGPYSQRCYLLTNEQPDGSFIGCNPINNYDIKCFLIDPTNKIILAGHLFLTGNPASAYRYESEQKAIYKISENNFEPTTVLEEPQRIFGISQADLDKDVEYILSLNSKADEWFFSDPFIKLEVPSIFSIFENIMQSFNQKTFGKLRIKNSEEINGHQFDNARGPVEVMLTLQALRSLTNTVALASHEFGHQIQSFNFKKEANFEDANNYKTNISPKLFNIEVNADMLGTLSLLLNNQSSAIMPMLFLDTLSQNFSPETGAIASVNDNTHSFAPDESFTQHPDTIVRLAYTLEIIEKFSAVKKSLLDSYKLTSRDKLNAKVYPWGVVRKTKDLISSR